VPDPKAQQASSPPLAVPRPLRTGGKFTIVLPKKRVLYRHWNKEVFLPGEEAELIVETDGTDGDKYELVLEKAPAEDGPWEQVTSLEAKADGGRRQGQVQVSQARAKGAPDQGRVEAQARRTGRSPRPPRRGGGLRRRLPFHTMGETAGGRLLGRLHALAGKDRERQVRRRVRRSPARPQGAGKRPRAQLAANKGRVLELTFEHSPVDGGRPGCGRGPRNLDKTQLRFVLERADESGTWVEIGSAVSTVRKGAARNSVPVPPLPPLPEQDAEDARNPIRFAIVRLHNSDDVVVSVDPEWSKGRPYQVEVKRRRLDEEGWQERVHRAAAAGAGKPWRPRS